MYTYVYAYTNMNMCMPLFRVDNTDMDMVQSMVQDFIILVFDLPPFLAGFGVRGTRHSMRLFYFK